MTLRATFAFMTAASALALACSSGNGAGFGAQPCGGDAGSCPLSLVCSGGFCVAPVSDAGSGALEGGSSVDGGATSTGDGGACVTEVPCASESQCVAVGGSTCNQVLHRCQTVFCLPDGQPCSNGGQCKGEICEPGGGDLNKGTCTNRQTQIASCAVDCARTMRAASLCSGHGLANVDAACAEICALFLDDKSCSKRVMNDAFCFDNGRCQIMDGCGKDFRSTSPCD